MALWDVGFKKWMALIFRNEGRSKVPMVIDSHTLTPGGLLRAASNMRCRLDDTYLPLVMCSVTTML